MPGWARRRLSLLALCLVWLPPTGQTSDIPILKPEDARQEEGCDLNGMSVSSAGEVNLERLSGMGGGRDHPAALCL